MTRRLARTAGALVLAGALAGLVGTVPPTSAAETSAASARSQAAALRAEVDEIGRRLAGTTAAYETARFDLGLATAEQVQVERALDEAESAHEREQQALRSRIRGVYTSGGGVALLAGLFSGSDPVDVVNRATVVQEVLTADREALRAAEAARRAAVQAEADAAAHARRQVTVDAAARLEAGELERLLAEQSRLLQAADAEVRRLVELETARERRRAAEAAAARAALEATSVRARVVPGEAVPGGTGRLPGRSSGGSSSDPGRSYRPVDMSGMACPVGPVHSFADTWLAARSGGRRHQGTDVFAPYGSTAYAVVDGVVDKVGNGGLGGITLWVRSDSGDRFYYAHNSANLVRLGERVRAGQPVALVGKTGNAATTPPHVHFEAHPGGGAAANPYAVLRSLCG